jgi:peptide/nickel transport system permease protein
MSDLVANVAMGTKNPGLVHRIRNKVPLLVVCGFFWLALMILVALFADWLRPYPITKMDLSARLAFPGTPGHWLGTDELGRDVLSRLLQSIRVSLVIAFGATLLSAVFGTTLGFLASRFRGMVEHVVLMLADFQAALPFMILSLSVLAFFGSSMTLLVCLMGFYGWERYARIARGLAISGCTSSTSCRMWLRP